LAFSLGSDDRKQLVKELEKDSGFSFIPGVFTAPIKGKGSALFNRDNSLYRMMGDMSSVLKGTGKALSLILDGKSEEAVSVVAKTMALEAHTISRINTERLRIHYPRELANKILRPKAEPILRKQHRAKAKEIA
jgi:hypothetical protein